MTFKKPCAATVVRIELVVVFILAGFLGGVSLMAVHERAALEAERSYHLAQRLTIQADQTARCSISLKEMADRCHCEFVIK